jgi:hypothetical protein
MSATTQIISAAALALSLAFAAHAADVVAPTDSSTPAPVQTEPRDTTRVPSDGQPQSVPENRSDEPVRDGSAREQEDDASYRVALQACEPLQAPERERCIEKAKEQYGRM